jgi:hypothetical protein
MKEQKKAAVWTCPLVFISGLQGMNVIGVVRHQPPSETSCCS